MSQQIAGVRAMAEQAQGLEQKLDVALRLLGMLVGTGLPISKRAVLLASAGLDRSSIAAICGTTPAVVSVRLAEGRRRPSKGARRPNKAKRANTGRSVR